MHLSLCFTGGGLSRRAGSNALPLSGFQACVPMHREPIRKAHAGCEQWLAPDLGVFAYCPICLAGSSILPPTLWLITHL